MEENISVSGVIYVIYTVTLNPSLDYMVETESFKVGCLNRSKKETITEGGKGINVSCVLKELGIKTKALGFAAGFTGEEVVARIKKRNIKTGFIMLEKGITRINVKINGKNETELNGMGPEIEEEDFEKLISLFDEAKKGDVFIFSGSAPKSKIKNMYERMAFEAHKREIRFAVDSEGQNLLSTLKYKPFLIKPNLKELEDIFNAKIETDEGVIAYGKKLQCYDGDGAENVLVSMGKQGAVLLCGDGRIMRHKAPKGNVVSTLGAGDSMLAGFMAGMELYNDHEKAFMLAAAAGSACAFSAGLPEKAKIMEVLKAIV